MTEIYNIRSRAVPSDAVNIMRPGTWGNPFSVEEWGREECIALYEHWLFLNPGFVSRMRRELRHKDLVCCCWPKPCHGNVIAKILAGEEPQPITDGEPLLVAYLGKKPDPLKDLLEELARMENNPAPVGDGGTSLQEYEAWAARLKPHLQRLTATRHELWPKPPVETVEISKADLICWRAEWLETQHQIAEQEPGTDIVTPFDHYLYGAK